MKSYITALLILIGAAGFSGCNTASHGAKIEQTTVTKIEKGVTTRADLIGMFGDPSSSNMRSDGREMLTWSGASARTDARKNIPFVGIFFEGRGSSEMKTLTVTLGKDGKVTEYNLTSANSKT